MFDGMFIVGIDTPIGQATYHYDIDPYWDLFHVKALLEEGVPRREIASGAGLHPYVAGKYETLARRFTKAQLRAVMEEMADLDQRIKTGLITDRLAVEVFIVKHSEKKHT